MPNKGKKEKRLFFLSQRRCHGLWAFINFVLSVWWDPLEVNQRVGIGFFCGLTCYKKIGE